MISSSPDQTKQIAVDFVKTLKGGEVIFLEGELGTGKTTFVQGAAKALGYDGPVRSPTFTIINIYSASHKTIKKIIHVDLYRIKNESELRALALEENVCSESVVLIEWPKIVDFLLKPSIIIRFDKSEKGEHIIHIDHLI